MGQRQTEEDEVGDEEVGRHTGQDDERLGPERLRPVGAVFVLGVDLVQPLALDRLDPSDELRVRWESFASSHGGDWKVHIDERTAMPTLAAGRGIEWIDESSLTQMGLDHLE